MTSPSIISPSINSSSDADETACPPQFRYQITRNADGHLEFDPPEDTTDLWDALQWWFPNEPSLVERKRRALEGYRSRNPTPTSMSLADSLTRQNSAVDLSLQTPSAHSSNAGTGGRGRRTLTSAERIEKAQNRGNTCAKHRNQKVKVSM
jgi:hypothetical protein